MLTAAVAGSDYTSTSINLVFLVGSPADAMQCVNVTIVDDDMFEGEETFAVVLTVITSRVMEGITVTTVTITDDEG